MNARQYLEGAGISSETLEKANKPSITRFTPTFFGGMAMLHTGMFVRHCDHLQELAEEQRKHGKTVEKLEVAKEQLQRMTDLKEIYNKNANKYQKSNVELKMENERLQGIGWKNLLAGILIGVVAMYSVFTH